MEKMEEDEGKKGGGGGGRLFKDEHPLLNPLVMTKVLELGKPNVETLKNIRLVCKTWSSLTFDLWRSKATLKLVEDEGVFRRRMPGGLSLSQFFSRFEDADDPFELASRPYARYKVVEMTIDMSLSEEESHPCKRFWDGVGPLMEYLHLEHCSFPKIPRLQFDRMLFGKIPNLNHLVITETGLTQLKTSLMPPEATVMQMKRERRKWKEQRHQNLERLELYGEIPAVHPYKIIARLPKLESLTIRNGPKKNYGDTISLLDAMSKLKLPETDSKMKIKELDVMHTNGFARWFSLPRTLSEWKLPLEILSVEIRPDQSRYEQPLQIFLQHHTSTLRVLKIFCAPLANPAIATPDTFPFEFNQDVLEELYLWGNVTKTFRFLKYMPSLKKVCIYRNCPDKWEEIKTAISRWNSNVMYRGGGRRNRVSIQPFNENLVQNAAVHCDMSLVMMPDLVHLYIDYEFFCDSISKLAEWMPNLKVLKTILNNTTFPVVCDKWSKLTELVCIFGSVVDDNRLTGMKTNGEGVPVRDEHVRAAITNLEYLKVFELQVLCDKGQLQDWSAEHGFLKMKRLETLKVCVSSKFTAEAEESLNKHIPNVQIIRNYGPGPHPNYDCCQVSKYISQIGRLQQIRVIEDEGSAWDSIESDLDIDVISMSDDDEDDDDDENNLGEDGTSSDNMSDDGDDDDWMGANDGDMYFGNDSDFSISDEDDDDDDADDQDDWDSDDDPIVH